MNIISFNYLSCAFSGTSPSLLFIACVFSMTSFANYVRKKREHAWLDNIIMMIFMNNKLYRQIIQTNYTEKLYRKINHILSWRCGWRHLFFILGHHAICHLLDSLNTFFNPHTFVMKLFEKLTK